MRWRISGVAMKLEDALRKIQLLRRVTRENGFSDGETENAERLSALLSRNFSLRPEDVRPARPTFRRPTWSYWQNLLNEFGLELQHFGKRGSCTIDSTHVVMIRADTAEWYAQQIGRAS